MYNAVLMKDDQEISHNYMDLIMQFGYVSLFSTVFPLAPLASYLCNALTMKAIYLEFECEKRCLPEVSIGIGKCLEMLDVLQFVTVIINCALIFFTNQSAERFLAPRFFEGIDERLHYVYFCLLVVFVEHFLILFKMALNELWTDKDPFFEKKRLNAIHAAAHEAK